jgi:transcription initiation factor TFIID subunit TAF12
MEFCCAHCGAGASENADKSPRYFKEDLLRVLTERNELKEQIDNLRDELGMAQA